MKKQGTGGGKMVTLGEVLSLATPRVAIMGKIWLLRVFRLLENAFATIADLKILNDTDGNTKPQPQIHVLLCKYLYTSFC